MKAIEVERVVLNALGLAVAFPPSALGTTRSTR
jgi:hypothetical protein